MNQFSYNFERSDQILLNNHIYTVTDINALRGRLAVELATAQIIPLTCLIRPIREIRVRYASGLATAIKLISELYNSRCKVTKFF